MSVYDARSKIQKKKVDEVVEAEAIIKAFKEKEKRVWIKISREAAKAGRGRLKRLKNQKKALFGFYSGL